MAQWTNFWRIVTPASRKASYQNAPVTVDDQMMGNAAYSSVSWFSNIMKGAASRAARYKQYDGMDQGDVSRALDIIAEEMSNPDKRTDLPLLITYQTEENQNIPDNVVVTLRAALRHWSNFHRLHKKIFNISRSMCKYGDCFFRKSSDTKPWEYIDPTRVIGIEIDPVSGEKIAYHVKLANNMSGAGRQEAAFDVVPAKAMLHFTLSDEMGETSPFGPSILQPAYADWQKLRMLEDASIIYRIVRAPERRVFYVDVGNMPPQRVKQYLQQIKNDIRQKRSLNPGSTGDNADSTYNPECLALDTEIPLLDGRTVTLQHLIEEHQAGKVNWAYSCDPQTGAVVPGIITWAGVTRRNSERIKLTFDNGKSVIVTPDHKFPIRGKGFVEARDIKFNDSLFPFNVKKTKTHGQEEHEQVWDNQTKTWNWTHAITAAFMREHQSHLQFVIPQNADVVHHVDLNRSNNSPANLMLMGADAQVALYRETTADWWTGLHPAHRAEAVALIATDTRKSHKNLPAEIRARHIEKATQKVRAFYTANKLASTESYVSCLNNEHSRLDASINLKYISEMAGLKAAHVGDCISQDAISRMIEIIKHNDAKSKDQTLALLSNDELFMSIYRNDNAQCERLSTKISDKYLRNVYSFIGISKWRELKEAALQYNHKVVSIESVATGDVGTITIDGNETFHKHHTFALSAGVFTKNSIQEDIYLPVTPSGRGSRVETLPGGAAWEIPELDHFAKKVFRALRVPTSYMSGQDGAGAQYNDGKVGIAYIEELRFANFIMRLQVCIEELLNAEFKTYLQVAGINLDPELFKLTLPEPQNFALYRQSALDADLINSFKSIEDTKYLSKRFILKRYLGLTEDDIQANEVMLKQEQSIKDSAELSELQQFYDPAVYDNRNSVVVPEPPIPEPQ